MSSEFLDNLNLQQRQAATIIDGYELMLAGAGTGKTHTLISRVAYMIEQGVPAYRILLLTFTTKAAKEMRDRLVSYVGDAGKGVCAMTFHAFVLKMLRDYRAMLNIPEYTVISAADDSSLFRSVRNGYLESFSKEQKKEFPSASVLRSVLSDSINKQMDIRVAMAAVEDESLEKYMNESLDIIQLYGAKKKAFDYVNYDDLLQVFMDVLNSNEFFVNALTDRFAYVMCDEYQDTNCLQERILQKLTSKNHNLCVVGDDNQSIYRFRAAEIENILSFSNRYPNCQVVPLTENYRSTQEILDVSNAVMEHVTVGIPKWLTGQCHGDKPLYVMSVDDVRAASHILDGVVYRHRYMGVPLSQMAVLVRHSQGSAYVEQECSKRGIDCVKYGGRKFLEKHSVNVLLSYLRLSLNDHDDLAWRNVLGEYPGIGAVTIEKLVPRLVEHGIGVVLHPERHFKQSVKLKAVFADFRGFWERFESSIRIVDKLNMTGTYYSNLLARRLERTSSDKEAEALKKFMNELSDDVEILKSMSVGLRSIRSFLDNMSLDGQTDDDENKDSLVISTIHSAKGLEWDTVFLLHPVDEVFNDWSGDSEALSEERRVMYVALTRAKNHLELVQAKHMVVHGQYVESTMSQFLDFPDVKNTLNFV